MKGLKRIAQQALAIVILAGSSLCFAQTSMNTTTAPKEQPKSMLQNFAMTFDMSRSRSLVDQKDASVAESNDFNLLLAYSFSKVNSLSLIAGYGQDLQNTEDSSATDIKLDYAHKIVPVNGYSDYNFKVSQIIPASKDSKDRQDLQYGIGLVGQMQSKPESILYGRMNLLGQLAITRYFHKYDVAYDESQNNQYTSSQTVRAGFVITKTMQFTLSVAHRNTWTYRGTPDQKYEHTEELGIDLTKNISMNLGHTLAAPDYKANGDTNVALTSDDNSRVYLGMTITL